MRFVCIIYDLSRPNSDTIFIVIKRTCIYFFKYPFSSNGSTLNHFFQSGRNNIMFNNNIFFFPVFPNTLKPSFNSRKQFNRSTVLS
ncbi:hypothetical protein BSAE_1758 [Bifidobacterium pullorum subsp. saeculare DSM 6531 = LMG 14934]|uniref:Uncharacterized protein n=1 Tax=Bifidobacterium pullorum subsp. saeculare DSM 6531 = LMG 14934 TaxID=1437611 RepID=A0A087CXX3_9BIFI|nr:hypothetical protein BSAE_1758 [Bifidobacterium pullorum subsp. saeculare DSM 6531 = LMG 14934]